MEAQELSIRHISQEDTGTQFRVLIDSEKVNEYAALLEEGVQLPPITVISDSIDFWVVDGWHRLRAYQKLGRDSIPAVVQVGNRNEAMIAALGANSAHGLPRSNDDKRKEELWALRTPEAKAASLGKPASQHDIARICGVTQAMVSKVKNAISLPKSDNGYQDRLHDPVAVAELLAKNDYHHKEFLDLMTRNRSYMWDKKLIARFEQLGLYNQSGNFGAWTEMATRVWDYIMEGNDWAKLEYELARLPDFDVNIWYSGKVRGLLEELMAAGGWVNEQKFSHADGPSWLHRLEIAGYVHQVSFNTFDPGRGFGMGYHRDFTFWHISVTGAALLGADLPEVPPAPTAESVTAQLQAEKDAFIAEQEQKKAAERDRAAHLRNQASPTDGQNEEEPSAFNTEDAFNDIVGDDDAPDPMADLVELIEELNEVLFLIPDAELHSRLSPLASQMAEIVATSQFADMEPA
ncbi:MAG: ParB/RepB/Spo0J family partition protein [Chloroflexota bacterium]|nr:ParB/RepB/Spo0J family partition protein [Chloroflexota bacterium]